MDWIRRSLVVALAGALGCGDDSGGDTDTDAATAPTATAPGTSSDTFDPPDTFPDTFDADSDPTEDPSSPTFTDSDPTEDPSSPTVTDADTNTDSDSDTTTGDTAADTDTATDTDTAADTDTATGTGDLPVLGLCCQAQDGAPGCDDDAITSCVCEHDPFCCDDQWDEACVVAVVIHGCGTCEGVGGDGDCCAANGTPGCDDDAIEACVCEADSVCCLEAWDETCALGVEFENCGQCP